MGYNWFNSNAQAADYLAEQMKAIVKLCESEVGTECKHGVILVTHSMGGLVARMCAKRNPSLIQWVVHGVQPAIGAATAYRRVRAGWEDTEGAIGIGGTWEKSFLFLPMLVDHSSCCQIIDMERVGYVLLVMEKTCFNFPRRA